jgi:uncharacterized protein YjbJ (UPF0337 family)
MGTIQNYMQKVSGKIDQAKGKLNQDRGQGLKGGFQEVKGKVKEKWADTKLEAQENRDIDYDHETI